jgi:hypothetical protein
MDPEERCSQKDAEEWLRSLREIERCEWCGESEKRLNREHLCAACKRTRKYGAKLRKETEAMPSTASKHERWKQTRELRIADKMVELCKSDGIAVETILNRSAFDVVSLERAFSSAALAICHQENFYHGSAIYLTLIFSEEQRRIIAYMLWEPTLVNRKRKRMMMATAHVDREDRRRAEKSIPDEQ